MFAHCDAHYNPFDPDPEVPLTPPPLSSSDGRTGQNEHPTTNVQSNPSGLNITTPSPIRRTVATSSSEVNQICQTLKRRFAEFAEKVKNLNLFNGTQWSAVGGSFKQLCSKIANGTFDEVKSAAKSLGQEIKALFRQKTTPQNVVENVGNILHQAGEALDRAETLGDIGNALGNMFRGFGHVAADAAHDAGNALRQRFGN